MVHRLWTGPGRLATSPLHAASVQAGISGIPRLHESADVQRYARACECASDHTILAHHSLALRRAEVLLIDRVPVERHPAVGTVEIRHAGEICRVRRGDGQQHRSKPRATDFRRRTVR
eukprot:SAG31_NODE_1370_length_8610_cov_2.897192_3_plen_118_part_00